MRHSNYKPFEREFRGEGLVAVRGYQSGAEGAAVAMPTLSREIETV